MKNIVLLGLQSISNIGDRLVYACTRKVIEELLQKHGVSDVAIVSYDMLGSDYYAYLDEKKLRDAENKTRFPLEAAFRLRLEEERAALTESRNEALRELSAMALGAALPQAALLSEEEKKALIAREAEARAAAYVAQLKADGAGYYTYKLHRKQRDPEIRGFYADETALRLRLEEEKALLAQTGNERLKSLSAQALAGVQPVAPALSEEEKQALITRETEERIAESKAAEKENKKKQLAASARKGAKAVINKDTAAVIFFGGGIIKPGHSLRLGYCMAAYIRRANELGVPVMVSAAGVDGYDPADKESRLFAEVLNLPCVKTVTVRDDIDLLQKAYVTAPHVRVRKVPCPTLMCSTLFPMGTIAEKRTVGLGVIMPARMVEMHPGFTEDMQIALWIGVARELENRGFQWKFFTNGVPEDQAFAKKILNAMGCENTFENILPRPQNVHQLLDAFHLFEGVIASRFHVAVPCCSYGIPFVEFIWNVKQIHFAKDMGLEDRFFDPETVTPAEVVDKLLQVMDQPAPGVPAEVQDTADELELFLRQQDIIPAPAETLAPENDPAPAEPPAAE